MDTETQKGLTQADTDRICLEAWADLEDVPFDETADGRLVLAVPFKNWPEERKEARFGLGLTATTRKEYAHFFMEREMPEKIIFKDTELLVSKTGTSEWTVTLVQKGRLTFEQIYGTKKAAVYAVERIEEMRRKI